MRRPFAERRDWRAIADQALIVALGGALVWLLVRETAAELQARGIGHGFAFLFEPAGFAIGEGVLDFDGAQPYWRAFAAGLLNTLRATAAGLALATGIGLAVGVGALAGNPLLRALARGYVEIFRNIPLLLQLLTWYFLIGDRLPTADAALNPWPGIFLSKGGLVLPWGGEVPVRGPFAIEGGATLTPEFLTVSLGLGCYTAAYLAEIVRAGVLAVPRGLVEAAAALGLTAGQRLRWVVLPLALRLILPPATSQILNLAKNASLAVVVGYPDLVSVANTSLNQTGQAVECLAIVVAVYLLLSLAAALVLARANARAQLRGRG